MLKNDSESKHCEPERQDATALRKRAADDAVRAADWYASKSWRQPDANVGSSSLGLVTELFCPKRMRPGAGSPDGIDGRLVHSVAGATSDELLEIFLAAEAEALGSQSMRIFRDNICWSGKYMGWMKQVH